MPLGVAVLINATSVLEKNVFYYCWAESANKCKLGQTG